MSSNIASLARKDQNLARDGKPEEVVGRLVLNCKAVSITASASLPTERVIEMAERVLEMLRAELAEQAPPPPEPEDAT